MKIRLFTIYREERKIVARVGAITTLVHIKTQTARSAIISQKPERNLNLDPPRLRITRALRPTLEWRRSYTTPATAHGRKLSGVERRLFTTSGTASRKKRAERITLEVRIITAVAHHHKNLDTRIDTHRVVIDSLQRTHMPLHDIEANDKSIIGITHPDGHFRSIRIQLRPSRLQGQAHSRPSACHAITHLCHQNEAQLKSWRTEAETDSPSLTVS